MGDEYQDWALCERVCLAAEQEASRDLAAAADWAQLAQEIAERLLAAGSFLLGAQDNPELRGAGQSN